MESGSDFAAPPCLVGVRVPKQARSRRTFARIVAAGDVLLASGDPADLTVQAVLERARIGSGSFYARFDDRDALLGFLYGRFWLAAGQDWATFLDPARWRRAPVHAVLETFLALLVRWHREHTGHVRALLRFAMTRFSSELLDVLAESDNVVADHLLELVLTRSPSIAHPEPDLASRLALLQSLATLRTRILFAPDGDSSGISDDAITRELTTMALAYLGVQRVPIPSSSEAGS